MREKQPSLFVTCGTGIESLLVDELTELGVKGLQSGFRGVYVDIWDATTIYKINYGSRLAVRVLLPLRQFRCYDANSLYHQSMKIDWESFLKPNQTFAIDANVHHRALRNSLYAAQVVKDSICDRIREKRGSRPSVDVQNPDVQLNLFIHDDNATISFDTSGLPLHKRGYRITGTEAPMQETLAAAILRLIGYTSKEILFDPCCGSGTLLIEAALIATKTPPGFLRQHWGFMNHPAFNQIEWLRVRNELDQNRIRLAPDHIFGIDLGRETVRVCKCNLKAAGFHREIEVVQADLRDFKPVITPTLIVANPPYGKRLEEPNLHPLYRGLGDLIQKCKARGAVLTNSETLANEIGLEIKQHYALNNGGIDTYLVLTQGE